MDISIVNSPLIIPILALLASAIILGILIYMVVLLIKALKVYIKKNS